MKITDAEFTIITPSRVVTQDELLREYRKLLKPKWRYNWWPLIGAAALELPGLLRALGTH